MKSVVYANCLKAVANDLRMGVLLELEKKPLSVQELCKRLGAEQSKVSHALQQLRHCNYVDVDSKGKQRFYSLKPAVGKGLKLEGKSANLFDFLETHRTVSCKGVCSLLR